MAKMPDAGDIVDGAFRVESVLGEGSFGAIYRVEHLVSEETLALKVQKTGSENPDEVRARFEREARYLYGLDHEHIVDILYYGQTDSGQPYMAMEFLLGTDLSRLLKSGFDFENAQIKRIAEETLSALSAAHKHKLIHRDLKPANIFLVDDGDHGHVKVLDFGFAKAVDDTGQRALTAEGVTVGAPAYMAPELVHKENVGPHSDLYALGLIIGEMIAGERLVQIDNVIKTVRFQASGEPVELPESVEHSPFRRIVKKSVRKDARGRYQTAEAMLEDLRRVDPERNTASLHNYEGVRTTTSAPFGETVHVDDVLDGESETDSVSETSVHILRLVIVVVSACIFTLLVWFFLL